MTNPQFGKLSTFASENLKVLQVRHEDVDLLHIFAKDGAGEFLHELYLSRKDATSLGAGKND